MQVVSSSMILPSYILLNITIVNASFLILLQASLWFVVLILLEAKIMCFHFHHKESVGWYWAWEEERKCVGWWRHVTRLIHFKELLIWCQFSLRCHQLALLLHYLGQKNWFRFPLHHMNTWSNRKLNKHGLIY